jgi:hypothetical protein
MSNLTLTTNILDFEFNQPRSSQKSPGSAVCFFWQGRPEKPTRPLTLNKDTVWCGPTCSIIKQFNDT